MGENSRIFLFNEKMLHLVDDIFWHLGFKSTEHAEKVMSQIINYCDYCNYCDYFHYFRLESIMASLRTHMRINTAPLQKRFVIWVKESAGVRQRLCNGWAHCLSQKDGADGVGQSAQLVETAMKDKIVVADGA